MGMKTGAIAKLLGIDIKTVKSWTDDFPAHFSGGALADGDRTHRLYSHDDLVVLNTIRVLKGRKFDNATIRDSLTNGNRDTNFPPQYYASDDASGENALQRFAELTTLRTQLNEREAEIQRLNDRLADKDKQLAEKEDRIEKLIREAMTYKIKLEMLEGKDDE